MSSVTVPEIPDIELIYEDGEPMESPWHRAQMELLIELTHKVWEGRTDYYTGGNMFLYFGLEQARKRDYRGPDYFAVTGVDGLKDRKAWVVWEEEGRYPDIIMELLSPSTRQVDLGEKKTLYESTFHTPEYVCFDPETGQLRGWRLLGARYEPLLPGEGGKLESQVLGVSLGLWSGTIDHIEGIWVRFWDAAGVMVPTTYERFDAERARAEAECARAEAERVRAEDEQLRADAAVKRIEMAQVAGRIVSLYYRNGPGAAAEELGRHLVDLGSELVGAVEAIDADVAAALRRPT